jgi:hypothetical protein
MGHVGRALDLGKTTSTLPRANCRGYHINHVNYRINHALPQVNEKIGNGTRFNMPTTNFTTDWHSGKRICSLVDSYVEGMFPGINW